MSQQCVVLTAVLLLPLLSCVRPLRFVAIGDWGDDDGIQYQVSADGGGTCQGSSGALQQQ